MCIVQGLQAQRSFRYNNYHDKKTNMAILKSFQKRLEENEKEQKLKEEKTGKKVTFSAAPTLKEVREELLKQNY